MVGRQVAFAAVARTVRGFNRPTIAPMCHRPVTCGRSPQLVPCAGPLMVKRAARYSGGRVGRRTLPVRTRVGAFITLSASLMVNPGRSKTASLRRPTSGAPLRAGFVMVKRVGVTDSSAQSVADRPSQPSGRSRRGSASLNGPVFPGCHQHSRAGRRHALKPRTYCGLDRTSARGARNQCGLSRRQAVVLPYGPRLSHSAITAMQLAPAYSLGGLRRIRSNAPKGCPAEKFRSARPASLQAGRRPAAQRRLRPWIGHGRVRAGDNHYAAPCSAGMAASGAAKTVSRN